MWKLNNMVSLPSSLSFSSHRSPNAALSHLPAGGPGPGQSGCAAGRPRHLHGQVHWAAVQPDHLLFHHDDRWDGSPRMCISLCCSMQPERDFPFIYFKRESWNYISPSSLPQEESVSRWRCWVPSWAAFWCGGWTSLWKEPANCAPLLSCSACLLPHLCCS